MTTKLGDIPHWILRQEYDINGKTCEIQIKLSLYQCWFLSFDKCSMVMGHVNSKLVYRRSVISLQHFYKSKIIPLYIKVVYLEKGEELLF